MNRTRRITIERHSITIIRTRGKDHSAHCEFCGETVPAFAPEQIAAAQQIDIAEVCRRVDVNRIHLTQSGRSTAVICGNSLQAEKVR